MSPTTHDLLQPMGSIVIDPTHLASLGKQAAALANNAGISLTDAVVQTVSTEKLAAEHIRRITEHANLEAFNQKYASLTPDARVVDIQGGPADPDAVWRSYRTQTEPKALVIDTLEYASPPVPSAKTAAAKVVDPDLFLPSRTPAGVRQDIYNLESKLASSLEEAIAGREAAEYRMSEALEKLAATAEGAGRAGATAEEVATAWSRVSPELAALVFPKVASCFEGNQKVAGRYIRPESQVVKDFELFAKHAASVQAHIQEVQAFEVELQNVKSWLSSNTAVVA